MDRGLSRSLPFLPRYHSVSPARAPRKYSSTRSLSQPSQRILYIEGERSKATNHYLLPRSPCPSPIRSLTSSPSPSRGVKVILLNTKFNTPLYRKSKSNSWNDINSSHCYSSLECLNRGKITEKRPEIVAMAAACSCDYIYHKGPFYPDNTSSHYESGISVGESEDDGGDCDETASQISCGSSATSAFFETTMDSEFDRCDSSDIESVLSDGKLSPAVWAARGGVHGRSTSERGGLVSPMSTSYAEARRRELMSSPSFEFDRAPSSIHQQHQILKVAIPDHDHRNRKDGGVVSSTPLAQSTPHVSPRSFYGPPMTLSVKGSWNADSGDDIGYNSRATSRLSSENDNTTSCCSSFSEDSNSLSDSCSSPKSNLSSPSPARKTKIPKKLSSTSKTHVGDTKGDYTPENLGIDIPPLESVIGFEDSVVEEEEENTPRGGQWWAVYNIGSANARRQEMDEIKEERASIAECAFDFSRDVKVVKLAQTGIPLISAGKHGQEKLKKSASPPLGSSSNVESTRNGDVSSSPSENSSDNIESWRKLVTSPSRDESSNKELSRTYSPPLLSLSPILLDRLSKKEISVSRNNAEGEGKHNLGGCEREEVEGREPCELEHVNDGEQNNVGNLPCSEMLDQQDVDTMGESLFKVTSSDRLNAHASCVPLLDNRNDISDQSSHGHQNTPSLVTADGVDVPSTNNRHYPLDNNNLLSTTGQAENGSGNKEDKEGKELKKITTPSHLNPIPGENEQVSVGRVGSAVVENKLGITGTGLSVVEKVTILPSFIHREPYRNKTTDKTSEYFSDKNSKLCLDSGVGSNILDLDGEDYKNANWDRFDFVDSPRVVKLCREFECLSLGDSVDPDATLMQEENDETLSKVEWAPDSNAGNVSVNVNIDTVRAGILVVKETIVLQNNKNDVHENTVSILSGNVGQEQTSRQQLLASTTNMNRLDNSGNPNAPLCLLCHRGSEENSNVRGCCDCQCMRDYSIDPIVIGLREGQQQDGENTPIRPERVVFATAQMPFTTTDGDNRSVEDELFDRTREDKISLIHSPKTSFHESESRGGVARGEFYSNTLPCGDEQSYVSCLTPGINNDPSNQIFHNIDDGTQIPADKNKSENVDDVLWQQQERFRQDFYDDERSDKVNVDGSINYSTTGGRRGDKGIPQVREEKEEIITNAQKDGRESSAVAERTRQTDNGEFLLQQSQSQTLHDGQPEATRADSNYYHGVDNGLTTATTIKIVKQIHRKTVEETVTIERSVLTPAHLSRSGVSDNNNDGSSSSSGGIHNSCSRSREGPGILNDGVVDYVTSSTNRKETVIEQEENVDYIFSPCESTDIVGDDDIVRFCYNVNNENNDAENSDYTVSRDSLSQRELSNEAERSAAVYTPVINEALKSPSVFQQNSEHPAYYSNTTTTTTNTTATNNNNTQFGQEIPVDSYSTGSEFIETTTVCPQYTMRGNSKVMCGDGSTLQRDAGQSIFSNSFNTGTSKKCLVTNPSPIHLHSFPANNQSVLDNLQAQLSHISNGDSGHFIAQDKSLALQNAAHQDTKYHDHGQAVTNLMMKQNTPIDREGVSGITGQHGNDKHIPPQYTNGGVSKTTASECQISPNMAGGCATGVVTSNNNINNNQHRPHNNTSRSESYDNDDYDYVVSTTDSQSDNLHLFPRHSHHHHVLLKPGHVKPSSLWTLQEETESLLEGLSPKPSPSRHFHSIAATGSEENAVIRFDSDANEKQDYQFLPPPPPEFMDENKNVYPSRCLNSAWGQRNRFSDSDSNYDELCDGMNYSSPFTTTNSGNGHQSTHIDHKVLRPLSDIETCPRALGGDKFDNNPRAARPSHVSPSTASAINSFHDFVNGLEMRDFAFDPANNESNVSSSYSIERDSNQIKSQDTQYRHQRQVHSFIVPDVSKQNSAFNVNGCFEKSSNSSLSMGRQNESLLSSSYSSSTPVYNEELMNSSIASSSNVNSSNQDIQSEASSRLQTLDLDLSRISSCASPTPSDFSDGLSAYTCSGTAEIKRSTTVSVSFDDDYDMLPAYSKFVSSSTPRKSTKVNALKSALKKKHTTFNNNNPRKDDMSSTQADWVKQFDQIIEDFNNKTCPLGPDPELMIVEGKCAETGQTIGSKHESPGDNGLYKTFTNEDTEKKQNHICIVDEPEDIDTFRFKRFLKKSHTRRNNKGKRIVRFLSRLSCVSESVQQQSSPPSSPEHVESSAYCRKKARLENGHAYTTDSMPLPAEREPSTLTCNTFHSQLLQRKSPTPTMDNNSPSSSIHSLDSLRSRTDSAYSSVSESVIQLNNSPQSQKSGNRHQHQLSSSSSIVDSNDKTLHVSFVSHPDSAFSSISESDASNPFSPSLPVEQSCDYSSDMLSALSDVFDQLEVCEEEIDQALLNRLRYSHQATAQNRKN